MLRSILLVMIFCSFVWGQDQSADIILINGKIFTSDVHQLYVEAVAIKGNLIWAIGSNKEIEKLASSRTKKIDLKGKTVVPGFNDAHDHLGWLAPVGKGYQYPNPTVRGLSSSQVLDSISRLVKISKPDQWVHGFIGLEVMRDTTIRRLLDEIAPNNPLLLQIWWGHGTILNSRALTLCGVSDADENPVGGWYERSLKSNKIHALQEYASWMSHSKWLSSEPEHLVGGLQAYAYSQLQFGVTSVQNMSSSLDASSATKFFHLANLPVRVRVIGWPQITTKGRQSLTWKKTERNPSTLTRISGIKYVIDGTPLEGNALMTKPYPGTNGWHGRLNFPVDTIRQILQEALTSNEQLMMHIVGDSTYSIVLSLMKKLATDSMWKPKRVRFEHNANPHLNPQNIKDIQDMGILVMHTPMYAQNSLIKSLISKGIRVGIAPDGLTNPFVNIKIITSEQVNANENLTREEAVIAYTLTNAYAEFKEHQKGTITKGKVADLVVLSQDIFTVPLDRLPETHSELTIINGNIVFEK